MNKKIIVTISAIIIYAVLYGFFIKVLNDKFGCDESSLCLRFCSEDTETFSDENLLDEFLKSKSGSEWGYSDRKYLKVHRGSPACGELKFIPPNKNITSRRLPYNFHYRGSIAIDGQRYDYRRYCLEQSDDVVDGWKLMICHQDVYYYKIFHMIAICFSILLFGMILFVYSYFKELRDFYGKFIIGFLISQIMAYAIVPTLVLNKNDSITRSSIGELVTIIYFGSMIMTLLWISVMVVHSFLTFKNFKEQSSKPHDFSIYAVFVVTILIFSGFVSASDGYGLMYLILIYFFIGFLDIFLLIVTGIKMFILTRHLSHSEQPIFDTERKWYWITLKLALVMLVTWPFEFVSLKSSNRFELFNNMVADFVMILTAIIVSIVLIGRTQVRVLLFGKYRGISNVET